MKVSERVPKGIIFYSDPEDIDYRFIDKLLRNAVRDINQSEWVWTAECCQGHIDTITDDAWNLEPYMRLVCEMKNRGRLLDRLMESSHYIEDGIPQAQHVIIFDDSIEDWAQIMVRFQTRTVYDRNQGCLAFERLGKLVNE